MGSQPFASVTATDEPAGPDREPDRVADLLRMHGTDALSFAALKTAIRHWFDAAPPAGTGGCVAYFDTAGAWVAIGSPLAPAAQRAYVASRFVAAARARGRRACFFGADSLRGDGLCRLLVGQQPIFSPSRWLADLTHRRRLREQLRRARAKGLTVRCADAGELSPQAPLRQAVDALGLEWLATRHLEPMHFAVTIEPFQRAHEHRYYVGERGGRVVAFLSAVPIRGSRGWLVEDVFRGDGAPNGTTEALIHALMADLPEGEYVTLGPTPLAGPVVWPLQVAARLMRPLFDFAGLHAFRQRLRPDRWEPVWLVYPASQSAPWAIGDVLCAFAGGSPARFAARSLLRHPSGVPWALAVPLPAWTAALGVLALVRRSSLLGFARGELWLWVAFDAFLLTLLVRAAMRPRRPRLVIATALAAVDAVLSAAHLRVAGPGATFTQFVLRALAAGAPVAGTALLAWAAAQTRTVWGE
jgi:phosphatidylglycerol lysyltransferase